MQVEKVLKVIVYKAKHNIIAIFKIFGRLQTHKYKLCKS